MSELRTDRCPVCGADNDCAVARFGNAAAAGCWCAGVTIADAAMAQIPPAARGRTCLCRRCAERAAPPPQEVGRERD